MQGGYLPKVSIGRSLSKRFKSQQGSIKTPTRVGFILQEINVKLNIHIIRPLRGIYEKT
jgi:hypothetical protein